MSATLITLIETHNAVHSHLVAGGSLHTAAGDDIFTTGTSLASKTNTMLKVAGSAIVTLIALIGAWKARGALAGVISAGIVAIIAGWFIFHAGDSGVQNKIGNTVNNGLAPISQQHQQAHQLYPLN